MEILFSIKPFSLFPFGNLPGLHFWGFFFGGGAVLGSLKDGEGVLGHLEGTLDQSGGND